LNDDESGLTDAGFLETVYGFGEATAPARRIGRFRLLQKLGEGGMGIVYEAEQVEPVRRKVALKVIKAGMDTEQVIRRFESERQALALMDHPAIARVYDAGATQDSRPFFAMELVHGLPINQYCDQYRLGLAARLELFVAVCEGIQHAHQKGIIHRDIKPSNVLVHEQDGRHVPKIIDFGVAKATAQRLTDRTLFTEMGQLLGTPEYMSPEQAEMSGLDVDTRTDVYLLGVLLYELLTGELPFGTSELREVGFDEFRRRVIQVEPALPSTRVTKLSRTTPEPALARRTDAGGLPKLLRGDLDWITMKALEKDRTRRYASASELARDVERHLRHEPVLAGPPSNLYRLRKFARRHRVGVAFAAVVTLLLASLGVTLAVQNARITAERDRANVEAATAGRIKDYLVGLFALADPTETAGETVTARQLLDQGAGTIGTLEEDPLVRARLLFAMSQAYAGIGMRAQARGMLETALATRRAVGGADDLEIADMLETLGGLIVFEDLDRAEQLYEEALALRRSRLGDDTLEVAASLESLGNALGDRGLHERAAELNREAFGIRERLLGPEAPQLASSLVNLAAQLKHQGRFAEAEEHLMRALRLIEREHGELHEKTALGYERLGNLYEQMRDYAAARDYHRRALAVRRQLYRSEPHEELASTLMSLAIVTAQLGDHAEAERLSAEAMAIYERTGGLDAHYEQYKLARYDALSGRSAEAISLLRRACVEQRYSNAERLLAEPSFETLRDDPGFQAVVAAVKRRTGEP
jgi:non-specific serine/threonine protein kinase/serine/threonine-protein kinase